MNGFESTSRFLPSLDQFLVTFVSLNLALTFFNLIPLAPLDGDKILAYLLPDNLADAFERIRPYGPMILLLLVLAGSFAGISVISSIIGPPIRFLFRLLVIS
jgi:Zn-dependent protease